MEAIFLRLVNISIMAGWLILLIIVVRHFLKRVPRWVFCLLWGFVGLRLMFPFSLESPFSLIPSAETVPAEILWSKSPALDSGMPAVDNVVNPVLAKTLSPDPLVSVNPVQLVVWAASLLWAFGMAAMLCYLIISYFRIYRRVGTATLLRDNIWQNEFVESPFILGLVRPRIYIPYHMEEKELSWVLAHEMAHLSRRDHFVKPAAFLLLSVYWFHPLVWCAYILLCRDMELACDEKVIRNLNEEQRKSYSLALIGRSGKSHLVTACPFAFGEIGIKERILHMKAYKKPVFWVILAAILICIVAVVCFLTNPVSRDSMRWARSVKVKDIEQIELVVMPQSADQQYRLITDQAEISEITALLHESRGRYQKNPEELAGGSHIFYITMKDGSRHEAGNIGNYYLFIDGDSYRADYDWLSSWGQKYGAGDARLPEDFFDAPYYVGMAADSLFANRTKYIGDHIAVGHIWGLLPFPSNMQYQQYALQTSEEPYEVTITYAVTKEDRESYESGQEEGMAVLRENACIMLALIENAGIVNFELVDETGQTSILSFDRAWAEDIMECDLWEESGSVEKLAELLTKIEERMESV